MEPYQLGQTFNKKLRQIIKILPEQLKINEKLIASDNKMHEEICVIPLENEYVYLWTKSFKETLDELNKIIETYKIIIPEFECVLRAFPNENYFRLELNHTSKSIVHSDILEGRKCYLFQPHRISSEIIYTKDQDYLWNNFRVLFYFEFPL